MIPTCPVSVCRLTEDLRERCYTLQLLTETRVPFAHFFCPFKGAGAVGFVNIFKEDFVIEAVLL